MKSILDPKFRYTNSVNTDIRKTFARARREMRKQAEQKKQEVVARVSPLFKAK